MRTFYTIWIGQLFSIIGSQVTRFSLGIWVFQKTGSATGFALVQLCNVVPGLVLAPFAGVLVDRLNRRTVMILADTMAAFSSAFLLTMLFNGELQLWHVFVVSVLGTSAETFQMPAYNAAVAQVVPKSKLTRANGLTEMAGGVGSLLSPLIAAGLMAFLGLKGVILLDLATFVIALVSLAMVRLESITPSAETTTEAPNFLTEMMGGYAFMRQHTGLLLLLAMLTVSYFATAMFLGLFTPLVLSFSTVAMLGTLASLEGAGMIAGGLLMSLWAGPKRLMRAIVAIEIICALCMIFGVLRPSIFLLGSATVLYMFLLPVSNSCIRTLWQRKVPLELQGRVYSFRSLVTSSMMPLALAICGPLSDKVLEPAMAPTGALAGSVGLVTGVGEGRGMALLLILCGFLILLAVALCLLHPRFRNLEDDIPDAL